MKTACSRSNLLPCSQARTTPVFGQITMERLTFMLVKWFTAVAIADLHRLLRSM